MGRRIRLRDLHVFATVVRCGSMAKAARQLGVSQPAVSEVIVGLEHALGVRLVDRSARGVQSTIYGDALLKRSVAVFDELKQTVRDIEFLSNPTVGELRIGCTESLATTILPQIISRYSRQYPGVAVHLDDVSAHAAEAPGPGLRERRYDCILQRITTPLNSADAVDDLDAEVLFDDQLVVVAGVHTAWARRRKIDLAELVDEPWILPPPGTWYYGFVTQLFRTRGLPVPKARLVTHSVALRNRVLGEMSYITTYAKSLISLNGDRYGLKLLPVDIATLRLPAGVLTLKHRTLSPIVERFVATARDIGKSFAAERTTLRSKTKIREPL